jgi:hypothetical protein
MQHVNFGLQTTCAGFNEFVHECNTKISCAARNALSPVDAGSFCPARSVQNLKWHTHLCFVYRLLVTICSCAEEHDQMLSDLGWTRSDYTTGYQRKAITSAFAAYEDMLQQVSMHCPAVGGR